MFSEDCLRLLEDQNISLRLQYKDKEYIATAVVHSEKGELLCAQKERSQSMTTAIETALREVGRMREDQKNRRRPYTTPVLRRIATLGPDNDVGKLV